MKREVTVWLNKDIKQRRPKQNTVSLSNNQFKSFHRIVK